MDNNTPLGLLKVPLVSRKPVLTALVEARQIEGRSWFDWLITSGLVYTNLGLSAPA